ncbi:unnamed protein product [Diatraea saccharalis]|uniref:Transport and Golgi organization protein 1 n=1 Tax=Diatraea saccharalis TaxID=40085 RepID=A0A9P0FXT2_9NEOP|nr:unnamed protein product [Diatraea saccharalis]
MNKLKFLLFILFVAPYECRVPDKVFCINDKCTDPISKAKTVLNFNSGDADFISFPAKADALVYMKSAGSNADIWYANVNGKFGFVNSKFLREHKILKKSSELIVIPLEPSHLQPNVQPNKVQQPHEVIDGTTIFTTEATTDVTQPESFTETPNLSNDNITPTLINVTPETLISQIEQNEITNDAFDNSEDNVNNSISSETINSSVNVEKINNTPTITSDKENSPQIDNNKNENENIVSDQLTQNDLVEQISKGDETENIQNEIAKSFLPQAIVSSTSESPLIDIVNNIPDQVVEENVNMLTNSEAAEKLPVPQALISSTNEEIPILMELNDGPDDLNLLKNTLTESETTEKSEQNTSSNIMKDDETPQLPQKPAETNDVPQPSMNLQQTELEKTERKLNKYTEEIVDNINGMNYETQNNEENTQIAQEPSPQTTNEQTIPAQKENSHNFTLINETSENNSQETQPIKIEEPNVTSEVNDKIQSSTESNLDTTTSKPETYDTSPAPHFIPDSSRVYRYSTEAPPLETPKEISSYEAINQNTILSPNNDEVSYYFVTEQPTEQTTASNTIDYSESVESILNDIPGPRTESTVETPEEENTEKAESIFSNIYSTMSDLWSASTEEQTTESLFNTEYSTSSPVIEKESVDEGFSFIKLIMAPFTSPSEESKAIFASGGQVCYTGDYCDGTSNEKSNRLLTFLVTTAISVLLFTLGYYYIDNKRQDGKLIATINTLQRDLLFTSKECEILKEELTTTKTKLAGIEESSFGMDDMVQSLKEEINELKAQNERLRKSLDDNEKLLRVSENTAGELQNTLSEVENTLSELLAERANSEEQIAELNGKIQAFEEELISVSRDRDNYQLKFVSAETALEEARKQTKRLNEVTQKLTDATNTIELQKHEIIALKVRNDQRDRYK